MSLLRVEGEEQTRVSLTCSQKALLEVVALLSQNSLLYPKTEILLLQKVTKSQNYFLSMYYLWELSILNTEMRKSMASQLSSATPVL